MAQQQYPVEVQSDFLEKITRAKPVQALAELVYVRWMPKLGQQ